MSPVDRQLLLWINGVAGSWEPLFELALFFCGSLPLAACVAVMLALWWTDPEGSRGTEPVLGGGPAPRRGGLQISRRRCVALGAAVAGAFICTRLVAFATDLPRPLGREPLAVPIDEGRWLPLVEGMTGFGAFPSDHAALFFALGVGLFAWRPLWGGLGLLAATGLSLCRVAVGFHYPSDMIVGAAIGAIFAALARLWAHSSHGLLDRVSGLFDRHPAVMYPLLFLAALDFVHHFRLLMGVIFYLAFTLLGADS